MFVTVMYILCEMSCSLIAFGYNWLTFVTTSIVDLVSKEVSPLARCSLDATR